MNSFPGLTWEFSPLLTSVNFMNMTISINTQTNIETMLFEKKLNLHLYIHPPPPPTLPIHLGSFQELSIVPRFEFLPLVQVMMNAKPAQRFFQMPDHTWLQEQ